jgi:DNA polymerase III alpha subunit
LPNHRETQEGYRNLINLVSTGFLEGFYYKPRIDKDLLALHSKGRHSYGVRTGLVQGLPACPDGITVQ